MSDPSQRRFTTGDAVKRFRQSLAIPRNAGGNANLRVPTRAWNRESVRIFADFQDVSGGDDRSSFSSDDSSSSPIDVNKELPERPHHVFDTKRKKQLVYIISLAGLFSPLSSNIYFPALGEIASELRVSVSLVALSITVYMIVQGIAPSFWGPYSDTIGRRPVFMGTFLVYLVANVGLGLSNNYFTLMFFRGLQAAGSAATISIGAGVIGDITTPAERGGLIGVFGGIRMLGQSIGPVFGGILTQFLGFRSIFWFLTILGSITLFLVIFFLPETLRSIAGDGTVRLVGIQKPLVYHVYPQADVLTEQDKNASRKSVSIGMIFSPLKFLAEKDVFITLFYGSIIYTIWSMVTSSTTALFQQNYHLNNLMIGLAFLPNGIGCVLGSYLTGILLDHNYRTVEAEYRTAHDLPPTAKINRKAVADFPIERARQRHIWIIILVFTISTAVYGFSLSLTSPGAIAFPLVLQFLIAFSATAVFSSNSALVIDLYPGASASATAVNNLMRCSVGAAGVAVVQILIDKLTARWAFLALAIVAGGLSPLLAVEARWGPEWRMARAERLKAEEVRRMELRGEKGGA